MLTAVPVSDFNVIFGKFKFKRFKIINRVAIILYNARNTYGERLVEGTSCLSSRCPVCFPFHLRISTKLFEEFDGTHF